MDNNDRTLKELATPDVARRSPQALEGISCGLFHNEAVGDTGILHQNEGISILPGWSCKGWLYLQPVLFNTWGDMKRMFLEKFFLVSRTVTIRKEMCGITQHSRETLHEYWQRFNKLCATCSHHQITKKLLIQYFYEGLTMMDQSMIDPASGGALMDKTLATTRHLISNMASNTQQFGIRGANQPRMVNKISVVDNLRLENQLTKLTSLVRQLAVGQNQQSIEATVCGICTFVEHPTDMCPTFVGAIDGYQYGKQPYQSRPFDNQQFRKQPFRPRPSQGPYAAQRFEPTPSTPQVPTGYRQPTPQYQAPPFQQQQQRMLAQGNSPSLEDLMKELAASNPEFQ
ncbi:hypothetical protein CR513_45384, partial [Mucuna pruriens]